MRFLLNMNAWADVGEALSQGAIVSLEDAAVRIRKLPITRQG